MLQRPPDPDRKLRRRLAQRRYRANKQNHVVVAPVQVGELMLNYLRSRRSLAPTTPTRNDALKIGEAIARGA